ncbi:MAG: YraN family protein [Candidatus Krumholzibacteriota bacterium]|nr:YraN family protein [Candidatus Krumholzibacteriota bacterium]
MNTRARGELGERVAAAFLAIKGYEVLRKNVWYARREIDIVARDGDTLVAVEVKLRLGDRFGRAVESVDSRKLERIRRAVAGIVRGMEPPVSPRIDVVAIDVSDDRNRMTVEHYIGVY